MNPKEQLAGLVDEWREKSPSDAYGRGMFRCAQDLAALLATSKDELEETEADVKCDVYDAITEMIEPHVSRAGSNPHAPFPASVHDTVRMLLDHWIATLPEQEVVAGTSKATLHRDRAGCEWFIVTSDESPDDESEVTPSDDPALFAFLKAVTAPPSAPVGVEGGDSEPGPVQVPGWARVSVESFVTIAEAFRKSSQPHIEWIGQRVRLVPERGEVR